MAYNRDPITNQLRFDGPPSMTSSNTIPRKLTNTPDDNFDYSSMSQVFDPKTGKWSLGQVYKPGDKFDPANGGTGNIEWSPWRSGGLGGLWDMIAAPAAFMVGGTSGADLATTGGKHLGTTLALDAAGLAAGAGLAGLGLGGTAAAGGTAAEGIGTAAAGGTAAEGAGAAAAGGGAADGLGGGMWDWLDTIDTLGPQTYESSAPFLSSGSDAAIPWLSNAPAGSVFSAGAAAPSIGALGLSASDLSPGFLSTLGDYAKSAASKLFGSGGTGGGSAPGIPGPFGNSIGNAAFDATPFLLAMYQANKQSDDLNGVLGQINGDAYQKSVLHPYDLDTGYGRTALRSDLGLRGVAGSSFGNQQLGNYDYMRALGRGDMASKAALASAGLQGQLINTRNTNENMLLGAGLNASARLFSPQQDPFNIAALSKLFSQGQ